MLQNFLKQWEFLFCFGNFVRFTPLHSSFRVTPQCPQYVRVLIAILVLQLDDSVFRTVQEFVLVFRMTEAVHDFSLHMRWVLGSYGCFQQIQGIEDVIFSLIEFSLSDFQTAKIAERVRKLESSLRTDLFKRSHCLI